MGIKDREPVAVAGGLQVIVQALLALLASYGVPISTLQQTLITTVVLGIAVFWTRSKVFAPVNAQGQPVQAVPIASVPPPPPVVIAGGIIASEDPNKAMREVDELARKLSGH